MNLGSFFSNILQYFDLEFLYNDILKQNFKKLIGFKTLHNEKSNLDNVSMNMNPQGIIFDMDGVLRVGEDMTLDSDKIINYLNQEDIKHIIITNESRKCPEKIHEELIQMVIDISLYNLYTSSYFLIKKLKEDAKQNEINVSLICSNDTEKYITDNLKNYNITISNNPIVGKRNIIVICEIDNTEYDCKCIDKLKTWLSHKSKIYITTPDTIVPDIDGWISPTDILEQANSNAKVDYISGKPNKDISHHIRDVFEGIDMNDILFVGDNIDTDIKMANIMGTESLLLTSGITTQNQLDNSDIQPDYILPSVHSLYMVLTNKYININKNNIL